MPGVSSQPCVHFCCFCSSAPAFHPPQIRKNLHLIEWSDPSTHFISCQGIRWPQKKQMTGDFGCDKDDLNELIIMLHGKQRVHHHEELEQQSHMMSMVTIIINTLMLNKVIHARYKLRLWWGYWFSSTYTIWSILALSQSWPYWMIYYLLAS